MMYGKVCCKTSVWDRYGAPREPKALEEMPPIVRGLIARHVQDKAVEIERVYEDGDAMAVEYKF